MVGRDRGIIQADGERLKKKDPIKSKKGSRQRVEDKGYVVKGRW